MDEREIYKNKRANKKIIVVLAILLIVLAAGSYLWWKSRQRESQREEKTNVNNGSLEKWEEEEVRIAGKYADADVVKIDGGRLRIYYSPEPEVADFEGQIYSAVSSDGLNWTQEEGVRMRWATFPSVIRLPDGRWRMYFQGSISEEQGGIGGNTGIVSAVSLDGLNWTREEGFRIEKGQNGDYDTENVAAPTVIKISDGSYLMVYRGSAGENRYGKIDEMSGKPSPIDYLISAVSEDGLNWNTRSVVVDSRNDKMRDQIDGPELVVDNNSIKLYCNSYEGVYLLSLDEDGKALSKPEIVLEAQGTRAPSDVTLIKNKEIWRMYFGIHTEGIFSARKLK